MATTEPRTERADRQGRRAYCDSTDSAFCWFSRVRATVYTYHTLPVRDRTLRAKCSSLLHETPAGEVLGPQGEQLSLDAVVHVQP